MKKILRGLIALTFFQARARTRPRWQDRHELADGTISPRVHAARAFWLRADWIHEWRIERLHRPAPAGADGRRDGALASARGSGCIDPFRPCARQLIFRRARRRATRRSRRSNHFWELAHQRRHFAWPALCLLVLARFGFAEPFAGTSERDALFVWQHSWSIRQRSLDHLSDQLHRLAHAGRVSTAAVADDVRAVGRRQSGRARQTA